MCLNLQASFGKTTLHTYSYTNLVKSMELRQDAKPQNTGAFGLSISKLKMKSAMMITAKDFHVLRRESQNPAPVTIVVTILCLQQSSTFFCHTGCKTVFTLAFVSGHLTATYMYM